MINQDKYKNYGNYKKDDARLDEAKYWRQISEDQENEQVANDMLDNDPENMSDFVDRGNV